MRLSQHLLALFSFWAHNKGRCPTRASNHHNHNYVHNNEPVFTSWSLRSRWRPYLQLLRAFHGARGASLWRGMSPGEIRQRSSSASRLRHGIDAESSRGGLMMFLSYPHTLLLFFCLSAFARCTWPVHSCCRLTAKPLSSHSCGVGGLPTHAGFLFARCCRSKLWTKATFT